MSTFEIRIDPGQPAFTGVRDPEDETLGDAIESAFPPDTECATLWWNDVPVSLGYRYDLSLVVPGLLPVLEQLLTERAGALRVTWPSNTFLATWTAWWHGGAVAVNAEWVSVVGSVDDLRAAPRIVLPVREFAGAWRPVLETVADALTAAGESSPELDRVLDITCSPHPSDGPPGSYPGEAGSSPAGEAT